MAFSKSCPSLVARGRCRGVVVQARFGRDSGLILGPNGPNNNGPKEPARLILPGQQRPGPPSGGRLVTPDRQGGPKKPSNEPNFLPDDSTLGLVSDINLLGGPPTLNKYRPPAGFMNESLPDDATANTDPQEMLNKLRARAGHWYDLAKFVPSLNSKGYNSAAIDDLAGITPVEQNKWVVSASVYESVKASPAVPRDVMARFDGPGVDLLYPFRFLGAERRVAAALYVIEQGLDPTMCDVLARSMKEYERRPTERGGFTDHPADCLAFKYLRDALECRRREEAVAKAEAGIKVVVSEGGRQRLMEQLADKPEADASSGVAATLVTLRLNPDELGVRPVCVVGELGAAQLKDLQAAPRTSQGGAFGIFTIDLPAASPGPPPSAASASASAPGPRSWSWVALPQWRALSMARHPVALTVRDCSSVAALMEGSKAKTDDDKRRMQGPGILVVDKALVTFEDGTLDEDAWYLGLPESGTSLIMVDGRRAATLAARGALFGKVVFLARPPVKEMADHGSELLQL